MCCVLFLMERFDDDTGPSGLSTAQRTRFVEVGEPARSVAGAGWGSAYAKDGRSDRIAAAVVWAIKGADAFRELLTVCQLAMVAARRAAPGKASHKRP
jgi:hypothetical protein